MPEKSITLYALTTCVHCKKTKEYLDDCGVKYDCIFVDKLEGEERKQMIETIKKVNPNLSFPTLLVDEEAIVGFKKDQIKDALER
ncbi:MAG: glutaredoxin family protein [Desulfomicrobium sp.]|jgi:glutaredoxin-like protein NrdH|nr:glutaredoxin family protein [Pseudomonadota bacterium]MBV1712522.1 glutaredoxin family protein [Desulfomicrobium sp.]MBU4571234.1 glutaredoxin family protein [Pseudomonadota bacterium]MBU4592971.1 glutaredoxin family protein [Pseudomonadota bacterium]MBV1720593.1 glutaredoxin family protein [Desulfomicrobium sp.]